MQLKLIAWMALASGICLATAACNKNNTAENAGASGAPGAEASATPEASGSTAAGNDHAAAFLTEAMKGDNSEVKLGKLAQDMGSSKGVKDLGKMLADDHGKHKDQVADVAKALSVPTTDDVKAEADTEYTKLKGLSGAAFDKEFVSSTVEDHKKDIDHYQQEASSSDPAQVTDLAKQTLPTLKKHLQTAQSLQK